MSEDRDNRIGIIGAGLVGTALAERLLDGGYQVLGYDNRPAQLERLREMEGLAAASASEVARRCGRVMLSLPSSTVATSVLDEIESQLAPGSTVIDTTTGAPEDAVAFADRLASRDVAYLDATVGGSSSQVRAGEAVFICGGAAQVFDACRDVLARCSRQVFHVGPAGSGARMKLVLNLVLGLNRAALAEGLEFARASGIDRATALEILKAGPAYSRAMDVKGERMLQERFEPEARLSQHLKDVRLILDAGCRSGALLPLSTLHRELLEKAEAAGFGEADNSAIIKIFQTDVRK